MLYGFKHTMCKWSFNELEAKPCMGLRKYQSNCSNYLIVELIFMAYYIYLLTIQIFNVRSWVTGIVWNLGVHPNTHLCEEIVYSFWNPSTVQSQGVIWLKFKIQILRVTPPLHMWMWKDHSDCREISNCRWFPLPIFLVKIVSPFVLVTRV